MKIADEYQPRADWKRPERISLLQKLLAEKGVPKAKVYLGGERFTFTYAGKFVNLVIYNYGRQGYKLVAAVYLDESSSRGDTICPLITRHPPKGCSEEEMIAQVGEILSGIT